MLRSLSRSILSKRNGFHNFTNGPSEQIKQAIVEKNIQNNYKYLLILDFEATCDDCVKIEQEIIEFPCIKVNANTFKEESKFHYYVKPVLNPKLTIFCTELTGILQDVVENAKKFPEVLALFENWRKIENLTEENSIYITSGDWDLGHMIPNQCELDGLQIPQHMTQWIDIKKMYANNFKQYYNSFAQIMKTFDLNFDGRKHSGIDDCYNMFKVVEKFGKLGLNFNPTSKLVNEKANRKVEVIGSKKFETPTIWNRKNSDKYY